MKLKHVHIENFKGLRKLDIPLMSEWGAEPRRITCLLGDNGSGKTTALQAIALTLSLATRRTRYPSDFRWHGFLPERVSSQGKTAVELVVALDPEEISVTHALYREWYDAQPSDWKQTHRVVEPGDSPEVNLIYEAGRVSSPQGMAAVNQFLGRYYIRWLARTDSSKKDVFAKLGDAFWFDQYRNLGSISSEREPNDRYREREGVEHEVENWAIGVEQLREYLVGWWAYYTSSVKGQGKTYIKDLERRFAELFPGTQFRGAIPREGVPAPSARDFYFLLERNDRLYDIAEMASGEQSVFCLLYDFVRLNMARSIVMIDELEMHLHAPAQQALYAALPKIGPDCQFIITTHSDFLTGIIPPEQEVRLEGGRRCL
jgi:energy-coupling factor transporter ATP-binding protein EcfA2